eukprot:TRINITY_DN62026_c0_g1_i1.p1 TRINITY_DN62026_c0_g1~~TRINITY_DN62026_c0_g1_i1.p1  ORF type:complete len:777 (-),score=143.63 TRINITY_DN62026_c0_g1_i1:47-2356(-)
MVLVPAPLDARSTSTPTRVLLRQQLLRLQAGARQQQTQVPKTNTRIASSAGGWLALSAAAASARLNSRKEGRTSSRAVASSTDLVPSRDKREVSLTTTQPQRGGFDPRSILRGPDGKILGGGDAPEPEGAEEFYRWLADRGCRGIEDFQLILGGGVALRRSCTRGVLAAGEEILFIPRSAWITAPETAQCSSAEALAWRLLNERWAGDASPYAPFVKQLLQSNFSAHPIMWEDEEVKWLKSSVECFELVNQVRATAQERVARLLARAAAAAPATAPVSQELLAQQARWALSAIEAQGFQMEENGGSFAAISPLVGNVRFQTERKASAVFELSEHGLSLGAKSSLKPGEELQQQFEQMSGAWLLANLGIVPGAELPGAVADKKLWDLHPPSTCWLDAPQVDPLKYPRETFLAEKMRLLKEYAGLDLYMPRLPDTPAKDVSFVLMNDTIGRGRLLPTTRFILANIICMAHEVDVWLDRYFVRFFKQCKLEKGYPSLHKNLVSEVGDGEEQTLRIGYDVALEMKAREMAHTWAAEAIYEKSLTIEQIAACTGLPMGDGNGVIAVSDGQNVMAYYKAKRKDGSVGKSNKPREAKVIAVESETLRVEFITNKRRHEIPRDWVVSARLLPKAEVLASGCSPEKLARGRLAITLLRVERAILAEYCNLITSTLNTIEHLQEVVDACKEKGDDEGAQKASNLLSQLVIREAVDVDGEDASMVPESIYDLPSIPKPGETVLDKPLWPDPMDDFDINKQDLSVEVISPGEVPRAAGKSE